MAERVEPFVFGHHLAELGRRYPDLVFLDADLVRVTESGFFHDAFPDRHFNLGIAEQNMVGIAAGLALSGRRVMAGSFACFMGRRVADQVAISVCYCRAAVTLVGMEAGLSSGRNGASHQAVEDLAIMRALPNMSIVMPSDATETRAVLDFAMTFRYPLYMRIQRGALPVLFDPQSYIFEFGKAVPLRQGRDVTIISGGNMLPRAMKAVDLLESAGIRAGLLNLHTLKPIDRTAISAAAQESGAIVTVEDHSIYGGVGSAVAEVTAETVPVPVVRVGVADAFGEVGTNDYLAEKYGLAPEHVVRAAHRAIALKKAGQATLR